MDLFELFITTVIQIIGLRLSRNDRISQHIVDYLLVVSLLLVWGVACWIVMRRAGGEVGRSLGGTICVLGTALGIYQVMMVADKEGGRLPYEVISIVLGGLTCLYYYGTLRVWYDRMGSDVQGLLTGRQWLPVYATQAPAAVDSSATGSHAAGLSATGSSAQSPHGSPMQSHAIVDELRRHEQILLSSISEQLRQHDDTLLSSISEQLRQHDDTLSSSISNRLIQHQGTLSLSISDLLRQHEDTLLSLVRLHENAILSHLREHRQTVSSDMQHLHRDVSRQLQQSRQHIIPSFEPPRYPRSDPEIIRLSHLDAAVMRMTTIDVQLFRSQSTIPQMLSPSTFITLEDSHMVALAQSFLRYASPMGSLGPSTVESDDEDEDGAVLP